MKVFITGASSGIGQALAQEYARRYPDAVLGLAARRSERLTELAASLPRARCLLYAIDVSDASALSRACADFVADAGCPDIVIANAGIGGGTLNGEPADDAVFKRIVDINVTAMSQTLSAFVTPMRAQRDGILVGIASVAGVRGLPGAGAYSASKAAATSLMESLRVELRGSGVSAVTVAPGYVRTPMTAANRYPMPFLMDVDRFAAKAVSAIERRRSYVVIPWQMGWVARLLRLMPNALYDLAFARAPRKAREK